MLHNHTRCIKTAICIILCSARMFPTAHFTLSADSPMNYAFSPPRPSSSAAPNRSSSERLRPHGQEVMQRRHKIFCGNLSCSFFLSSFFLFELSALHSAFYLCTVISCSLVVSFIVLSCDLSLFWFVWSFYRPCLVVLYLLYSFFLRLSFSTLLYWYLYLI